MQVTARLIGGLVLFSAAMSGAALGTKFHGMMIGEINRRRPDDNQVSYFGWSLPKIRRLNAEYQRVYPGGRLHVYRRVAIGVASIAMMAALICIGWLG